MPPKSDWPWLIISTSAAVSGVLTMAMADDMIMVNIGQLLAFAGAVGLTLPGMLRGVMRK